MKKKEINDITTIEVNGTTYEVYKIVSTANMTYTSPTMNYSVNTYAIEYRRISDLALIKQDNKVELDPTMYYANITYNPPFKEFDYPIAIGKKWNASYTQYITRSTGNGNDQASSRQITSHYKCIGKENISVKGMVFNCYVIRQTNYESELDTDSPATHVYLNSSVGNLVKSEYYLNETAKQEINMTAYINLISYNYNPSIGNQKPVSRINSPINNSTVKDTVGISGVAFDVDGVIKKVQLKVDDGEWFDVAEDATNRITWTHSWHTIKIENGKHMIYTRAWDGTVYSDVDSIVVNVKNEKDDVPGFEMLLLFVVIIIMLLGMRMKRKNNTF